jgi:hypothetical protein
MDWHHRIKINLNCSQIAQKCTQECFLKFYHRFYPKYIIIYGYSACIQLPWGASHPLKLIKRNLVKGMADPPSPPRLCLLLFFHTPLGGSNATTAISFVGGAPPVYLWRHDLILMSSYVLFLTNILPFPSSFTFTMSSNSGPSESNLWRSERICSAGYHPWMTCGLPEIVSVMYDIQGEWNPSN